MPIWPDPLSLCFLTPAHPHPVPRDRAWLLRYTMIPCVRHCSTPADLLGRSPVPAPGLCCSRMDWSLFSCRGQSWTVFCRFPILPEDLQYNYGRSAPAFRPALVYAFHHRSLQGDQRAPFATLCACAVESWRDFGRRGNCNCPGASISDLCALGGGSYFGLGLGWALLVC